MFMVTEGEKCLITPEGAKPVFFILEGKTPVRPPAKPNGRNCASSEEVSWALAVGIVLPVPFQMLYCEAQNNCN